MISHRVRIGRTIVLEMDMGTDNTRMQIRALLEEINVSFHMGRKLHEMAIINEKIGVFDVMEAIFTCVFFHKVNFLRVESESYF